MPLALLSLPLPASAPELPAPQAPLKAEDPASSDSAAAAASSANRSLDTAVQELMRRGQVPGLAVAVIRGGRVVHSRAYGIAVPRSDVRSERPLRTDSILYAASLTKATFAWMVMQLVQEGALDLDASLPQLLREPLPAYAAYADLAADERWRQITLRQLLSHSSGLPNWRVFMPGGRLEFSFAPGERYVYSGEGIQLAQLVVEERTGQPLTQLMQQRVFGPLGMQDTSLIWQDRFRDRVAMGFAADGSLRAQRMASRARAAGSMVTTLDDYARFMAAVLRREALSSAAHRQMLAPQIRIESPRQFPSHWPGRTEVNQAIGLAAGLGWIVHRSPRGRVFFKEGNDDGTHNFALGFADTGDGLVLLANSSRGETIFYPLVELLFSPSCLPWFWMGYMPYDRLELLRPEHRERPLGPDRSCLEALRDP
ncbi:MAG: beta-lactamase family protein [Rubrivivax sp.]|nr:beta-lactamase family protein [Rubrivivax sp.]